MMSNDQFFSGMPFNSEGKTATAWLHQMALQAEDIFLKNRICELMQVIYQAADWLVFKRAKIYHMPTHAMMQQSIG